MKGVYSTSNSKKKTRISKTLMINEKQFGKRKEISENISKLKNEINNLSRYNTLTINESVKQENDENDIINDYEIEKIKSKNLSKFKLNNKNSTTQLNEKGYIRLNDKKKNNFQINRNNLSNNHLINGGNSKNNPEKYNLKIALNNRNPIKLRKINTNIEKNYLLEDNNLLIDDKNLETINTLSTINFRENKISKSKKDEEIINKLKEEIKNLKEENSNNDIIINDLKIKLNENLEGKLSEESEDSETNEEINIDQNFLNSIEENNIFNKLRANYIYNKNLINQLTNQNSELKIKIINKSNNIIRRGNSDENQFKPNYKIRKINAFSIYHNDKSNNNISDIKTNVLNDYVEKKLKSHNRDPFMIKQLDEVTKEKITFMLKMIINANNVKKDDIINLFMNNLLDYYKIVEKFASDYLNIVNSPDIKILKIYFKSIFFDSEKRFSVNNAFNEILSFYDDEIKKLGEINAAKVYNKYKTFIENILKKCKKKDLLNSGLIELDKFKNIFNEFQHEKEFKKVDINVLIYNMKKKESEDQIGLFFLYYHNLCNMFNLKELLKNNCDKENEKNSSSKKRKNRFK